LNPLHTLNAPQTLPEPSLVGPILVDPGTEPTLLRSMVHHDGRKVTHAISVGDPSGLHYAMDLERAALLYAWRGEFVDATPMWHSRGQDQLAEPQGSVVNLAGLPSLAALDGESTPWPASYGEGDGFRFDGYARDEDGRPTFLYHLGGVAVEDRIAPADADEGLERSLTLRADGSAPNNLWLGIAQGRTIERLPDGTYAVDGKRFYIEFEDAARPEMRTRGEQQALLLPVRFDGGEAHLSYRLVW
jgi:hypothetical protein